jgi:hypothetical protein
MERSISILIIQTKNVWTRDDDTNTLADPAI